MKILLICSQTQNIYNFRLPLIRCLKDCGYDVVTAGFGDPFFSELESLGVRCIDLGNFDRSSGFFELFMLKAKYRRVLRQQRPDAVFTFMTKPNLFATVAARQLGIGKIFSMVEGAGNAFADFSCRWTLIKKIECVLYKRAFRQAAKVFFLNQDDIKEFVALKLVDKARAERICGVGVDLDKFCYRAADEDSSTFVMASRLMRNKGVMEYCAAAREVKSRFPAARFILLGAPRDIRLADLQPYIDDGSVIYRGNVTDVTPYLEQSLCCVLPSYYREGLPMSIMEAEAVGRCVITTDSVGCRETVVPGYNGWLIPPRDARALAESCLYVLNHKAEAVEKGKNARAYAQAHFDQKLINGRIVQEINRLMKG